MMVNEIYIRNDRKVRECILAFCDENVDGGGLSVGGAARVIATVRLDGIVNGEPALGWSWFGLHGDAAARRIVIYHPTIMIPEDVLGRRWTLQNEESPRFSAPSPIYTLASCSHCRV